MRKTSADVNGCEPQTMPQIDSLLIMDRTVDLLTPLLFQLTYEGLIDEIFNIKTSKLTFLFVTCVLIYICNLDAIYIYTAYIH